MVLKLLYANGGDFSSTEVDCLPISRLDLDKTTVIRYNFQEYAGVAQLLERILAKDEAQG